MEKTVTTSLFDGNCDGPQVSIWDSTGCQMYVISRNDMNFISSHDDMKNPAFYVLIGSQNGSPAAYVGQTDDFIHRIKDHDYKKTFWTKALVFMREGSKLTANEVKYLEYLGYKAATEAGTYSMDENKQKVREPTLKPYEKSPIRSLFEIFRSLADFRGYHVFTKIKPNSEPELHKLFILERKETKARGYIDGNGFVVVKGSRIDPSVTNWLTEKHKDEERNEILSKTANLVDGVWVLYMDIRFASANRAAMFCAGGSINSLTAWKDEDNRPLGDFIRDRGQL